MTRRTDWLQKISTTLANEHEAIIIEDLNVAGMIRWNGGIAKSITLDFSWGAFVRMLGYKMAWQAARHDSPFLPVEQNVLGVRCREQHIGACRLALDMPVLRGGARPGRERGDQHQARGLAHPVGERNKGHETNTTAGTAGINASGNPARPVPSMARVDERRIHVL
nr:hypothetical protein [Candidatus Sigynarchaeota archaeon]